MATFSFDENLSPQDNIGRFLNHLDSVDHEMAALFRANFGLLVPLPEGMQRSARRVQFNEAILAGLETLPDSPEKPQV